MDKAVELRYLFKTDEGEIFYCGEPPESRVSRTNAIAKAEVEKTRQRSNHPAHQDKVIKKKNKKSESIEVVDTTCSNYKQRHAIDAKVISSFMTPAEVTLEKNLNESKKSTQFKNWYDGEVDTLTKVVYQR